MRVYTNLAPFAEELERLAVRTGRELLRRIDDLGFDGVEVHLSLLEQPQGKLLFEGLEYSQVSFHSNHLDFNLAANNRRVREAAVRQLVEEIHLAREHGVRILTFHPGSVGKRLSREQSHEEAIRGLERVFDQTGLNAGSEPILCLENMDSEPTKLCRTEDEISLMLQRLPALSLTCDLAHLGMNHLDGTEFVRRFADRIRHFHASGVQAGRKHSAVPLPESVVDVAPALTQCRCQGAIVCIENRTLELALASLRHLRSIKTTW